MKFGVIGCGEIAYRANGPAIRESSTCEIVMATDPVAEIAASFGEEFGCPHTTDLEELLSNDEVEAVAIATPHYLHSPLAVQAANAGKHVLTEKPIACTLEQADLMIEACKANGVKLGVLVIRNAAQTLKAKELIDAGAIGKVVGIQFHYMAAKPDSYWVQGYSGRVTTDWRMSKEKSGGGPLVMNLVHDIDRFRFMTGLEALRVSCEYDTFATDVEVEDYISVVFRYNNGAIGTATASSMARGGRGHGNRIVGAEGQIVFGRGLEVYTTKDGHGLTADEWNPVEIERGGNSRAEYYDRFATAVAEGRTPDNPGEEGRKTLETILGAYEAGETGQAVKLG